MNIEPTDESDLPVPTSEYLPVLRQSQPAPQTTAAQAKTDAISALTLSAYQRASQLALNDEEVKSLLADFPDEAFKPGAAGKENLLYIEHAFLRDRLNTVFRPGQWAIVPRSRWAEAFKTKPSDQHPQGQDASRVYVEAMLCIRGCFAAEAVGEMEYYPHNTGQNYGDAVEGAKTAALRRCAKELGIGLQAWKKDWCDGWWQRKRNGTKPQNAPPASTVAVSSPPKPQTAQRGAEPPKTQPVASQSKRTPKEESAHLVQLSAWLEQCKTSLVAKLEPVRDGANEYARKVGMVLPDIEILQDAAPSKLFPSVDWNLSVEQNKTAVKKDFDALTAAVQSFMDGDALPEPEDQIPGAEVPEVKVPRDEHLDPNSPDAPWRSFPMPWGKQAGIKLADLDKKYLYGMWANYTVETEYKGKAKKPESIAKDTLFRAHLDSAGAYYEFTKKD